MNPETWIRIAWGALGFAFVFGAGLLGGFVLGMIAASRPAKAARKP